jgi:hypothetical protein
MGRELVYEHSREQLQAEIDREKAALERTRGQQSRRSVT